MFLSISLPLSRNLTPSLSYHIISYVNQIAKVTVFLSFCPFGISIFPFLTIGISMYQKRILPYFIIPSTFSPQASSPLERSGQTEKILHPLLPKFFFSLWAHGALPAGATLLGWPNYGVDGRLNKEELNLKAMRSFLENAPTSKTIQRANTRFICAEVISWKLTHPFTTTKKDIGTLS